MMNRLCVLSLLLLAFSEIARADDKDGKQSGSIFVLTTPEGAGLDASATVDDFPLLVRLHKDFFDFSQAQANGQDLRFSTREGKPLAYEIEKWDPVEGIAAVWVRIPRIHGNSRAEIKLRWGNPLAAGKSSAKSVFNEQNGYMSVWHMNRKVEDVVGTLQSKDLGTKESLGVVGGARRFSGGAGVFCGDNISNYPAGDASHTTEAWFRAEKPNVTIIGWGNEGGGRGSKVRMQFRSPPHVHIDSDFSDVNGESTLPLSEWVHVVHTYDKGQGKIYINGRLDGSAEPALAIKSPARLWIGGWYDNYDFVGEIDEVRVSSRARSADWVKLEYENQKPLQTLSGPIVQSGDEFSIAPIKAVVSEAKSAAFEAKAGGAQKLYWYLVSDDGRENLVAVDRFGFTFEAGRVVGDQSMTLRLKAVYPNELKSVNIPIVVKEDIPEPAFTLEAPTDWDGRATIHVEAKIANQSAMDAKGAARSSYDWDLSEMAVVKETAPGKLILKRAMNSGKLTVACSVKNGGKPTTRSITINVKEPGRDVWVARTPDKDEKPVENQFYARNSNNVGLLYYNGILEKPAESVFLKLYADERLMNTVDAKPKSDGSYALSTKLEPGLVKYKVEFGTAATGKQTVLDTVGNLVCGDVYLINGQSNAIATDFGEEEPTYRSEWIRTYGGMSGDAKSSTSWGAAVHRNRNEEKLQIGYWGMELGRRLVENQRIPICILNGAVGGTRIDQHQRNSADPEDLNTIYGRLLHRVRQAKLTHGVRGVIWHQGENDQGADGPTGQFGWETYRKYFLAMAAAWKEDYPNIQHYYLFQIWPKSCAMGFKGSDNRLREVQRTLPNAFSNMSIMSTLGVEPPGGCHFPAAGYGELARLMCPLVERDNYEKRSQGSITPPNFVRAFYTSKNRTEIVMEFDQPVKWDDALASQFYLADEGGKVKSGRKEGNAITLKLDSPSKARMLTYLDSDHWSQKTLLRGENGIAALTFCEVPISAENPSE